MNRVSRQLGPKGIDTLAKSNCADVELVWRDCMRGVSIERFLRMCTQKQDLLKQCMALQKVLLWDLALFSHDGKTQITKVLADEVLEARLRKASSSYEDYVDRVGGEADRNFVRQVREMQRAQAAEGDVAGSALDGNK